VAERIKEKSPTVSICVGGSMTRPKIFVIGLSKTGTSTLKCMLLTLGYRVCGPRKDLLAAVRRGQVSAINETLDAYDAFEDWPWPLVYRYVFEKYGSSAYFILTVRQDESAWFRSIENHGYSTRIFRSMTDAYGYYRPFGRRTEFCEIYNRHNNEVRSFFSAYPRQFIEFCLEKGDGWEKLCWFLDQPVPQGPVPHRNKTDLRRKPLSRYLNAMIAPLYRRLS